MSSQIFVGPSLNKHAERTGATPAQRGVSATLTAAARRRAELRFRVGVVLYLLCIAFVCTPIIGVFFGIGLYLLEHPTKEIVANTSPSDRGGVAPFAAKSEMPSSAVVPHSAPLAGEAAAAGATPGPAMITKTLGVLAQLGANGSEADQTPRVHARAETFGIPPASRPEPSKGQDGRHSALTRPREASTETVHGTITEVPDAMTWIVGNQTVRLWGIRPGPQDRIHSLDRFVDWVRAKGPIECRRQELSGRYQCATATGENIAEAALLAGVDRGAEAQARRKGNGLWASQ